MKRRYSRTAPLLSGIQTGRPAAPKHIDGGDGPLEVRHLRGDATAPEGDGTRIIIHVCNDVGAWGAGFVMALSRRWPQTELAYKAWANEQMTARSFELGSIQLVTVSDDTRVANMVAQHDFRRGGRRAPLRYGALYKCMEQVADLALKFPRPSIHGPRLGCGIAGGEWPFVEALLTEAFIDRGIPVTIYDP